MTADKRFPAWRSWLRRVGWAFTTLVTLALISVATVSELRNLVLYKVAPGFARDANLLRLTSGKVTVYLLGTIHGGHLSTPEYGLAELGGVITNLRPTLLLVEARPEELAKGNWGDGPIEMPYAALTARAMGLAVDGIDWWELTGARVLRTDENRDDRIFANLVARLPAHGTVLVLVGYSHVPELAERLERTGYERTPLADDEKTALFQPSRESFTYPVGMGAAIRRRIEAVEAEAATKPAEVATQLRALADDRRRYLAEIERVGEGAAATTP